MYLNPWGKMNIIEIKEMLQYSFGTHVITLERKDNTNVQDFVCQRVYDNSDDRKYDKNFTGNRFLNI